MKTTRSIGKLKKISNEESFDDIYINNSVDHYISSSTHKNNLENNRIYKGLTKKYNQVFYDKRDVQINVSDIN
jgi:hypothetical protein